MIILKISSVNEGNNLVHPFDKDASINEGIAKLQAKYEIPDYSRKPFHYKDVEITEIVENFDKIMEWIKYSSLC